MKVTICGAGRAGHLHAVLFKQRPSLTVSVLTGSTAVADLWAEGENVWEAHTPDGHILSGRPDYVGTDPGKALAETDVIIVTHPAHSRPLLLQQIASCIPRSRRVFLGAIPGFCGFDWLAFDAFGKHDNVVIWGMKDVPHTAFDLIPGRRVRMGGAKAELFAALHQKENAADGADLAGILSELFSAPLTMLSNYLEITLTPGNALMHPAVLYGLVGPGAPWQNKPFDEPICWWSDCPRAGAEMIEACDSENQAICRAVEARLRIDLSTVKPLRQELIESYGSQIGDRSTMHALLRTNRAYADIRAPLVSNPAGPGLVIDRESRAFHEDVAFGQALLVDMAKRLSVAIPNIKKIYHWAHRFHGGLTEGALSYVPANWPKVT
jgi:hypothetical protein